MPNIMRKTNFFIHTKIHQTQPKRKVILKESLALYSQVKHEKNINNFRVFEETCKRTPSRLFNNDPH